MSIRSFSIKFACVSCFLMGALTLRAQTDPGPRPGPA